MVREETAQSACRLFIIVEPEHMDVGAEDIFSDYPLTVSFHGTYFNNWLGVSRP